MNIKNIIRKVLQEDYIPTETEYLGWSVPKDLYDDLEKIGLKIWNKDTDRIYVAEIQFDNRAVVFEILDSNGEIYDNDPNIPGTFNSYYNFKIGHLPTTLRHYIIRRLKYNWINYLT